MSIIANSDVTNSEDHKTVPTATNVAYGMVSCDQRPSGEEGSPMYELVNQSRQPSASSATPTTASTAAPSTTQQQCHETEEPAYAVISNK